MNAVLRMVAGIAPVAALLLAACAPPPPPQQAAAGGHDLYVRYCASCHGEGGRGDGPAAGALQPPPNDLTQLAAFYGKAPTEADVMASIDGRRPVRAHGTASMPVWGESFESELRQREKAYPATTTLRRVQLIADYVLSLQSK